MNLITMASIGVLIYNVGLKRNTAAEKLLATLVQSGKLTQAEANALRQQAASQGTDLAALIAGAIPGGS